MPIWLRRFTFNKLKEHFERQNEENEKQQNMLNNKQTSSKEIARPLLPPPGVSCPYLSDFSSVFRFIKGIYLILVTSA